MNDESSNSNESASLLAPMDDVEAHSATPGRSCIGRQPLKVVHYTSELAPIIWGGLGLAVSGLATAQKQLGHDVVVILPYCDSIRISGHAPEVVTSLTVNRFMDLIEEDVGPSAADGYEDLSEKYTFQCLVMRLHSYDGLLVYFMHHPTLNGQSIYSYSNSQRDVHLMLASAAIEIAKRVIFPGGFDVFNCHDWTTAFACYLMNKRRSTPQTAAGEKNAAPSFFKNIVSVLTVHNFAHQGVVPIDAALKMGLNSSLFDPFILLNGEFNLLRLGLLYADRVMTVSAAHRDETLYGKEAFGNSDILQIRAARGEYLGILNGIDSGSWDPATDNVIKSNYSATSFKNGKKLNKLAFQQMCGLLEDERVPMICACSRITEQKGFHFLLEHARYLVVEINVQIVVIGDVVGDDESGKKLLSQMKALVTEFPTSLFVAPFSEELERHADAACDIFYMCSIFEPGGISNQHAGRYGAVVVATPVGGLRESTIDCRLDPERGNGFLASDVSGERIKEALCAAVQMLLSDPDTWARVVRNAMERPCSWRDVSLRYLDVYRDAARDKAAAGDSSGNSSFVGYRATVASSLLEVEERMGSVRKRVRDGAQALYQSTSRDAYDTIGFQGMEEGKGSGGSGGGHKELHGSGGGGRKEGGGGWCGGWCSSLWWFFTTCGGCIIVEFDTELLWNLGTVFNSCRTMPGKADFMYVIAKSSTINLAARCYFVISSVADGDLEIGYGILSLCWYQFQDVIFTLFGQTYMKFLGKIHDLLKINGAKLGDLLFVFMMLFFQESANRAILGPMGDSPSIFSLAGVLTVIVNLTQGILSGGPVDPAINKLRESGVVSHHTAMHIYQITGFSMLFGLFATFGYQEIHAILLGTQFFLSMTVYIVFSIFRNPAATIRNTLRSIRLTLFSYCCCCFDQRRKFRESSPVVSLRDLNLSIGTDDDQHFPSPDDWSDELIYSIMVDRFSTTKPVQKISRSINGNVSLGGNLRGIQNRLEYLQELGVTAILLSPIQTNAADCVDGRESYHGYAPINMVEVDPKFGTMRHFRELVVEGHKRGIRTILDFSINHTGPVFEYAQGSGEWDGFDKGPKPIREWKHQLKPTELMSEEHFSRFGSIRSWEDEAQIRNGDFPPNLRRFATQHEATQDILLNIMRYWMKETDIDGFRLDAIKHVHPQFVTRLFNELKAYAESLGKRNFLLLGEVSSGIDKDIVPYLIHNPACSAYNYPDYRRVNFALHARAPTRELELSVRRSLDVFGDYSKQLVRFIDNHDCYRFLRAGESEDVLYVGLAYLILSVGVPMLYYGTEQGFRQNTDRLDPECPEFPADPENRAPMFIQKMPDPMDPSAAPLKDHVFDMGSPAYLFIKRLADVRKTFPMLRRGSQVVRWSSPVGPGIFAFSRTYEGREAVVVINTSDTVKTAAIPIDASINNPGLEYQDALDSRGYIVAVSKSTQIANNRSVCVHVSVPPRGAYGARILVPRSLIDISGEA